MANSPSFVEHALDLLSEAGAVQARRMFGGHGVYVRGVMFALLDDDELFLKTDAESRPRFVEAGCRNWVYPGAGMEQTSYYRPPDEAHEDPEAMRPWARLAVDAALRLKAAKDAKAKAKAARATRSATVRPERRLRAAEPESRDNRRPRAAGPKSKPTRRR